MFFKNFFNKREVKEDTSFDDFFKESVYQLEQIRKMQEEKAKREKELDDWFNQESEYQKWLKEKHQKECEYYDKKWFS